jgi:hypothetical protein
MYIKLDRNTCDHQLAICERCLGKVLKDPMGYERQCFLDVVEDGKEELTLEIIDGDTSRVLVLDEEQRLMMAGEGWAKVLDADVAWYRK